MNKLKYTVILLLFAFSISNVSYSQNHDSELFPVNGAVFHIDSMPSVNIDEIVINAKPSRKFRRKIHKYNRLVRKVSKVYPYAKLANKRISDIENNLKLIESETDRKKYIEVAEKELFDEFEKPITNLSFSEGRILIKLIDRETGDTSYELIKKLRGRFSAFFWQTVAVVFGSNLKAEYDPESEMMIENIIVRIENGEIPVNTIE